MGKGVLRAYNINILKYVVRLLPNIRHSMHFIWVLFYVRIFRFVEQTWNISSAQLHQNSKILHFEYGFRRNAENAFTCQIQVQNIFKWKENRTKLFRKNKTKKLPNKIKPIYFVMLRRRKRNKTKRNKKTIAENRKKDIFHSEGGRGRKRPWNTCGLIEILGIDLFFFCMWVMNGDAGALLWNDMGLKEEQNTKN